MRHLRLSMLILTFFTLFGLMSWPPPVHAYTFDPFAKTCDADTADTAGCAGRPINPGENPIYGPNGIVNKVANIIAAIGGVIAVAMIVYGGLQMILSGGESQKVSNGRNIIIYSAVGIVIIIMARVIIGFVLNRIS